MEKYTFYDWSSLWGNYIWNSSRVCLYGSLYDERCSPASTAEIGSVIIFPGTMSVIIFGYIGGILVDRRGPLYVLNIGVTFLSVSFLTASFLLETTSWFMTIIIVFVLGGLSFTKTVISTIVSSSLKQQEAGAGMSLLNFTSFLSEGTGIAIVGGLLS